MFFRNYINKIYILNIRWESVSWREDLSATEEAAIYFLILGAFVLLISGSFSYILQLMIPRISDHELLGRMFGLNSGMNAFAFLMLGLGIFLSFKRLDDRLGLHEHFEKLNYSYLVLLIPNLFYSIHHFILRYIYDYLENSRAIFFLGNTLIPTVRRILFLSMLILLLIKIFHKKGLFKNSR